MADKKGLESRNRLWNLTDHKKLSDVVRKLRIIIVEQLKIGPDCDQNVW